MLSWALLVALGAAPTDLVASGIVLHPTAARSAAILYSGGRTRVVSVDDTAFGGRVVSITANTVIVQFESGHVELHLGPVIDAPIPAPAAPLAAAAEAAEDPATPHREMVRANVERRLGTEIPRILSDTALAPAIEDGRIVGLTVTRLPEGTVLSDAGLRAGDVITEINGTAIDGMASLIGLWPRLQSETEVRAVVRRAGKPVALSVTLR